MEKRYSAESTEKKWQDSWKKQEIHRFDANSKKQVYAIDTPPPTVNGNIHMGHLSSYIHIDVTARHMRKTGREVYFPFGYDDNGLPTERYVEKKLNKKAYMMPRQEFIDHCLGMTAILEKDFEALYTSAGFSCELSKTYSSIDQNAQKISQTSFLDLYKKNKLIYEKATTLWCTECKTAIAQSEVEFHDIDSHFNTISFKVENGEKEEHLFIATTRPEMLAACDCVFIHPKNEKYNKYIGKNVIVPHYNFVVPVLANVDADPEKGTGIVMCCTFGDDADKKWQREYNLEIKEAIDDLGRMTAITGELEGLKVAEARKKIIELLSHEGLLVKQEPITHGVACHERCGKPIEILVKKQWFIDVLSHKDELYQAGLDLNWYPETMRGRYLNWVKSLEWNWCISRQRYFGVPFPVWYCAKCSAIILADEMDLPVDPQKDKPNKKCACGCSELVPETDVMDTWATSSLTPQLSANLLTGKGLSDAMTPMNLRPNAHDNIRVWDFYTIVKSLYHFNKLPWTDLMISGFILAGDKEKLAKSKANSDTTPQNIIKNWSADVTRYWASNTTLGKDSIFGLDEFSNGRKLVNKLYNVAVFCEPFLTGFGPDERAELLPMDQWILAEFLEAQKKYEDSFKTYELGHALQHLEKFFWNFCDNYIEICKKRLYQPEVFGEESKRSAQHTLYLILRSMLKMFSVYMPHVTEEIYMSLFAPALKEKSIHQTIYDEKHEKAAGDANIKAAGRAFVEVLAQARKYKSEKNVSQKEEIAEMVLTGFSMLNNSDLLIDLKAVTHTQKITFKEGEEKEVEFK